MATTIKFEHVFKRYNLGLSRVSLPALVSGWAKQSLRDSPRGPIDGRSLWALNDVSFSLAQGQSLGLIGPNGAGKSTILKLLARITTPTLGYLETHGKLSALIELGAGFHPDLTGRENIYLNGTILGLRRKEIEHHFDEIVAFSELEQFIDTPVKRYSSGMVVRLGFSVASCIHPEILLVDEVLAVGDASFQKKCMQRIQSLLNDGTSIIFVSHNMYLVQAVCSLGLYLNHGQVKSSGSAREVIDVYERDIHTHRAQALEKDSSDRQPEGSNINILNVTILDSNGIETNELRTENPASIRIEYEALNNVGPVTVAFHVVRSDGLTCCMGRTSVDNFSLSVNRGKGAVIVTLNPLQLIGGTYFAEAHFLNASDSMGIVSGASDWFHVKGKALSYEDRSGVFSPHTQWDHLRN